MIPTIIQLGPLPVNSFGLMLVLGLLAGWWRLLLNFETVGEDPALAERMVFWAGVGGVVGARIAYLATFPQEFLNDPLGAIFSGAGFVFYGGLIGGTIAVLLCIRKSERSTREFLDLAAAPLAIGYAVGRLGCQLSGDGDYGIESSLPWAVSYSLGVFPTPEGVLVHPTPVYETLMALATAVVLVRCYERKTFASYGQLFGLYLLLTALARFAVEFVRIEPRVALNLSQAQWISIPLFIIGLSMLLSKSAEVIAGSRD